VAVDGFGTAKRGLGGPIQAPPRCTKQPFRQRPVDQSPYNGPLLSSFNVPIKGLNLI